MVDGFLKSIRRFLIRNTGCEVATPNEKCRYSVLESALILGVTSSCVRKAISQGKLRAEKVGEYWVIDSKDLSSFIEKRKTRRGKYKKR
jgi:excisionase family DNA binding protein